MREALQPAAVAADGISLLRPAVQKRERGAGKPDPEQCQSVFGVYPVKCGERGDCDPHSESHALQHKWEELAGAFGGTFFFTVPDELVDREPEDTCEFGKRSDIGAGETRFP